MIAAFVSDEELKALSRLSLAVVCYGSAFASAALAIMTHPKYTPHMILVSFWSTWAGVTLTDLAVPGIQLPLIPDQYLVVNMNGALIVSLGGWTVFAMRLWREAVLVRRAETALGRAMRHISDLDDSVVLDPTGEHHV